MPTHSTEVYYKIRIPQRNYNFFAICALQDFDEYDYETERWLTDDEGIVSFNSREEAREYLAANVDEVWIIGEDRITSNHVNYYKKS